MYLAEKLQVVDKGSGWEEAVVAIFTFIIL